MPFLFFFAAVLAFVVLRKSRLKKGYRPNNYPDHINDAISVITYRIEGCTTINDLISVTDMIQHLKEDYGWLWGIDIIADELESMRQNRITVLRMELIESEYKTCLN